MNNTLNEEQTNQLKNLKGYFPFRIVWGEIDKETGIFSTFANFTKHKMNKSVRNGNLVFLVGN